MGFLSSHLLFQNRNHHWTFFRWRRAGRRGGDEEVSPRTKKKKNARAAAGLCLYFSLPRRLSLSSLSTATRPKTITHHIIDQRSFFPFRRHFHTHTMEQCFFFFFDRERETREKTCKQKISQPKKPQLRFQKKKTLISFIILTLSQR